MPRAHTHLSAGCRSEEVIRRHVTYGSRGTDEHIFLPFQSAVTSTHPHIASFIVYEHHSLSSLPLLSAIHPSLHSSLFFLCCLAIAPSPSAHRFVHSRFQHPPPSLSLCLRPPLLSSFSLNLTHPNETNGSRSSPVLVQRACPLLLGADDLRRPAIHLPVLICTEGSQCKVQATARTVLL